MKEAAPRPLSRDEVTAIMETVLDHVEHLVLPDDFRLVGTAASVLHGVDLPAHDIDILARKRYVVDDFAWGLQRYPCPNPPAGDNGYFTRFLVDGVTVEIAIVEIEDAPDGIETYGDGPWLHADVLPCGSRQVAVVALELRLATELYRNRPDRYGPILDRLRTQGYDRKLLRAALTARGMPEERQMNLLSWLS